MSLSLKNDILNAVRGGYQPIGDPSTKSVNWSKPPTTGSNAYKPNPNYVPQATIHTPCDSTQVIYVNESNSKRIKRLNRENKDLQNRIKELEYSVEHLHKVIDNIGVKERFYYKKLKDLGYNPDADYAIGYSSNLDKHYASCTGYKSNSSKSSVKVLIKRVKHGKSSCKNYKFR